VAPTPPTPPPPPPPITIGIIISLRAKNVVDSNESLRKNLEAVQGKHSIGSLDSYTWNIIHNTDSTAV
jgi:hypothetical protein